MLSKFVSLRAGTVITVSPLVWTENIFGSCPKSFWGHAFTIIVKKSSHFLCIFFSSREDACKSNNKGKNKMSKILEPLCRKEWEHIKNKDDLIAHFSGWLWKWIILQWQWISYNYSLFLLLKDIAIKSMHFSCIFWIFLLFAAIVKYHNMEC